MNRQSDDTCIIQCLKLRHWALSLLSGAIRPAASAAGVPAVPRDAWELFLAIESVGGALEKALGAEVVHLPPDARAAITGGARRELQRVMAARAQLRAIDEWAAKAGIHPVVLKGGVHAADGGESFDLGDIDLLVPPHERESFTRMLAEHEYVQDARSGDFRIAAGIPLDLHTSLVTRDSVDLIGDMTKRVPLTGCRVLRRLDPAAHLIYCIQHSTSTHPHRRGHLRDLLLVADAIADCSSEELAHIDALLTRASTTAYRETFEAASRLRERSGVASDSFALTAAGMYAMAQWYPTPGSPRFPAQFHLVPYMLASRSDAIRAARTYLSGKYSDAAAPKATLLDAIARAPYRVVALGWAVMLSAWISMRWSTHWRPKSRR